MNFEKYLTEELPTASDFVNGIKRWLGDFENAYKHGNLKLAKKILDNIYKEVNKMKKSV